ncbi:heavy-metal-associated domain-containing protein [Mailhella massiliensis]|uniref:Heavy-metal-associated domain-containing protein n=1 Tax=Mailhella massiliensis TaxID=1903261 RepID=A0A921AWE5_9BACT|nr:heavy-metal-associated domain-containing protein [Mailhella massiliensis]HJD97003.1 heavy-metal-associated domain-containing protein [Mailhella massiliensis]
MKKVMTIEGMRCPHCSANVEKALCGVSGVSGVVVDLASKTATMEAGEEVVDETLRKAIDDIGFQVVDIR